ncbi:MAG: hypothetical protein L0241_07045 [Planctomycetia bacterium]|nr:hypothetical protein [Planctomycetia bacterium]
MDAVDSPVAVRQVRPRAKATIRAFVLFLPLFCALTICAVVASAQPTVPKPIVKSPIAQLLPHGAGTRELRNPDWSNDPADPFPMPPEMAGVELMKQTADQAFTKSLGCIGCHQNVGDPHDKPTLRLGCTDCHGGDATAATKEKAHVHPKMPQFWPTSANPVRSYTLLNNESPAYIRFVNPGDLRINHISCGTAGCHPKEVQTNRKQIMNTGCMLIGAAAYNNGMLPVKQAVIGEAYGMNGAPLRLKTFPPPTPEEQKKGVIAQLDPLPRFEITQPGNVFRIFEPGGRFFPEIGIPERLEEPGRPRTRLSIRGLGTMNRTDPVLVSATKTRLFDPTLSFMGTNDNPGDYRNSGCTACHVVYANDRSPIHSAQYAKHGNRGLSANADPTIPKNESGHPIDHKFTNSIPTSQCMVCHVHPGTSVMNSYLGYMWYDEETEARFMYPAKQKNPTAEELIRSMLRNPNESAARGNLSDPEFVAELSQLNPHLSKIHFADFHSHGWAFRAVFKKDRKGNYIDHKGAFVGPPTAEKLKTAVDWPMKAKKFHQDIRYPDPVTGPKQARDAETKLNDSCRNGQPVHLMDIHMEKGMHCIDCHFSQDVHGSGRLHMEVRAATEILCVDCHGTVTNYANLKTSGPASYTSAPDGKGRNLLALKTPFGTPRFEVRDLPDGTKRYFQNSCVEKGLQWELVQVKDTINKDHPRYNAKGTLAKTVRYEPDPANPGKDRMVWGDVPSDPKKCAHTNDNMSCMACHTSWNPSCYGCHLPQKANLKMPQLHADGAVQRNYTAYNFQTLRDCTYMIGRDGDVTGNKIGPVRSSCAIHVGSYNGNRESIYVQQPTISSEGFSGIAFSSNVPHTVRGRGARETKQCTDCHLSKANDNNAIMAQLLMHGTGFMNFMGKWTWVAAGEEGLFGVQVTEATEPQAVFGSDLHRFAYPDNYAKHAAKGGLICNAHEHPGRDIATGVKKPFKKSEVLMVQPRGEFLYAACGDAGIRLFDIAFIDDKAFAERITTAPVSPIGQKFYLPTKYATYIAAPCTPQVDTTRTRIPGNKEQPIHPLLAYLYVCDKYEGLILTPGMRSLDGNPINNFLKREVTFNPDGLLYDAKHVTIVGTYAYVSCDAGLVVIDINDPKNPQVTSVIGEKFIKHPKMVATQFRYAYVCDEEGVKVLDITNLAKPVPKSLIRVPEAHMIYLARTYGYVAAGKHGMVILDITNAEEPKVDQVYNAQGHMCDVHDIKLGITYNSLFAYVADGKNGMRIVQLFSPETPGFEGFSPRPAPRLVATYRLPHGGHIISVGRALDRDRAVDECGNQIGVFGRVGARPLTGDEQRKLFLHKDLPYWVTDNPDDKTLYHRNNNGPKKRRRRVK